MLTPAYPALSGKIFGFNAEREAIVSDVIAREYERKAASQSALELAINDAAVQEIARLEGARKSPALDRWRDVYRTLGHRPLAEKQALYRRLLADSARGIVGNFDPKVYNFATRAVPYGLTWLFKKQSRLPALSPSLADRIHVEGHTDTLRALAERGTVILVPTHSSNLDSLVIGYALYHLGLPPFTYGAGKNLFTNALLSFFMHNLGAYKVDRRLTYGLYKDVLKTYSTVLLERGYHSLFFPGGGRSRSNALESRLKLGLVGTGLAAYINNLRAGKPNPEVFVVPATLNYHLVLEAETLIDDQLQRVGKSRYIIENDESAQARRIASFVHQMLKLDTSMVIRFGEPLDPFGNAVDRDGVSRDLRGRAIDIRKYVEVDGEARHRAQRDAEYTRELGGAIASSYRKNAVVLSTHLVAFALFGLAKERHPQLDLFQLLRLPDDTAYPLAEVCERIDRLRDRLVRLGEAGEVVLGDHVRDDGTEALVDQALRIFGVYHTRPLAERAGDEVRLVDLKLLLYYHNRLTGYGLEEALFPQEARP
ncbi:MAG TPA: 1-acyl-sn-glycerol-3-phosphate acyltransferase [Pantanalinema sp.]